MRSKDRVGALAVGVRDDREEGPSLSALHRMWPACPGGLLFHTFALCKSLSYPEADVLT